MGEIMKNIKIIDKLNITEEGLISLDDIDKKSQKVFLKQGDADGACGLYCTFMALLICGATTREKLVEVNLNENGSLTPLMNSFKKFSPLFKEGTTTFDLSKAIKKNFKEDITFTPKEEINSNLIDILKEELLNDNPMIVGVIFPSGIGHWVLAVGMEYTISSNQNINVNKIFVLDSLGEEPKYSYWNQVIIVGKNQNSYKWLTREDNVEGYFSIRLDEGITIEDKK